MQVLFYDDILIFCFIQHCCLVFLDESQMCIGRTPVSRHSWSLISPVIPPSVPWSLPTNQWWGGYTQAPRDPIQTSTVTSISSPKVIARVPGCRFWHSLLPYSLLRLFKGVQGCKAGSETRGENTHFPYFFLTTTWQERGWLRERETGWARVKGIELDKEKGRDRE